MKEAMKYKAYLDRGEAKSQADLARKLGVSRAKVTQMLNLLNLDGAIREFILSLGGKDERLKAFTERRLRPLIRMDRSEQQRAFREILLIAD